MMDDLSFFIPADALNALETGQSEEVVLGLLSKRLEAEYGDKAHDKALDLLELYRDLIDEQKGAA